MLLHGASVRLPIPVLLNGCFVDENSRQQLQDRHDHRSAMLHGLPLLSSHGGAPLSPPTRGPLRPPPLRSSGLVRSIVGREQSTTVEGDAANVRETLALARIGA